KYKEYEKDVAIEEIDGLQLVKKLAKNMEEMFHKKSEAVRSHELDAGVWSWMLECGAGCWSVELDAGVLDAHKLVFASLYAAGAYISLDLNAESNSREKGCNLVTFSNGFLKQVLSVYLGDPSDFKSLPLEGPSFVEARPQRVCLHCIFSFWGF
ncbi:hypothetical protein STEG23_019624, partial [Scotinomys teguina]